MFAQNDILHSQSPQEQLKVQQQKPQEVPQSPIGENDKQGFSEKDNCINSEYKLKQLWKKQINNYFYSRKKFTRGRELKKWPLWASILQNLLRCSVEQNYNSFCQKPDRFLSKKSESAYKLETVQPLSVLNKPAKSSNLHFIILSYRLQPIRKPCFVFDLELLSLDGRIQFAKINFKNQEQLKVQLQILCQLYSTVMLVALEKQKIMNLHAQNSEEFLKWIGDFQDINLINTFEQKQAINLMKIGSSNKIQQLDHAKIYVDIKKAIGKYLFLKKQFEMRLTKGSDQKFISQDEAMTMILANNLLNRVISPDKQFEQQVAPYRSAILQSFLQANNKLRKVKGLVDNNKGHFPFNLDNAHLCWSCKAKRVYTYCPTCTSLEGHPIALCLNCYQPYHQKRIKQIPQVREQQNQILLNSWQALDESFQKSIRQTQQNSAKKQQNDLNSQ